MGAYNEVMTLITDKPVTERGDTHYVVLRELEVFGARKSVKGAEFYAAMAARIKVTDVIEIYLDDYQSAIVKEHGHKYKPRLVKLNDDIFQIIRTYSKDDSSIELTVLEVE